MSSKKKKYRACTIEDLKKSRCYGLDIILDGAMNRYFLVLHENKVYSYLNRCPHIGINLEWNPHQFLDNNNEFIQCATHGALFNIENGRCLRGPCVGDRLQKVENTVQEGSIYLIL